MYSFFSLQLICPVREKRKEKSRRSEIKVEMVAGASVEEAIASSSMSRLGWSLVVGHSVVSWGMRRPEIATVTLRPPLSVASTRVESIFRGVCVAAPDRRPSRKRASAVGASPGTLAGCSTLRNQEALVMPRAVAGREKMRVEAKRQQTGGVVEDVCNGNGPLWGAECSERPATQRWQSNPYRGEIKGTRPRSGSGSTAS